MLVCLYASVVVALHVPAVQRRVAVAVGEAVSAKLATRVTVGTVSLGMLNRIIIDDVTIDDQSRRPLLAVHRLSAKLDVVALLRGRIEVTSAQIFGMRAALVKPSADSPMNFQFVLDSLASKDTTSHTPLDLCIQSLVVRNSSVTFDRLDRPRRRDVIDPNHISLAQVSGHIMLSTLTDDSLAVRLKHLAFTELGSGFALSHLSFVAEAGRHSAVLRDFSLRTEHSDVSLEGTAEFDASRHVTAFRLRSNHSSIGTADLACLVPALRQEGRTVFIDSDISGAYNHVAVNALTINTSSRGLSLTASGRVASEAYIFDAIKRGKGLRWNVEVPRLHAAADESGVLLKALGIDLPILAKAGDIDYALSAGGTEAVTHADGMLSTAVGTVRHKATLQGRRVAVEATTSTLALGALLGTKAVGDTQLSLKASASLAPLGDIKADITAPLLTLGGYAYRNVSTTASLHGDVATLAASLEDAAANLDLRLTATNAAALLHGDIKALRDVRLTTDIRSLNPSLLGLTTRYPGAVFSAVGEAAVHSLNDPLAALTLALRDITMTSPDDRYRCSQIALSARESAGHRDIALTSDFAELHASGRFTPATLGQSLTNLIAQRLPTLPGMPHYVPQHNDISISADITDMSLVRRLLGVKVLADSPIALRGFLDDRTGQADLTLRAPHLDISGTVLDSTEVHLHSPGDTLHIAASSRRRDADNRHFALNLTGTAADNTLATSLTWSNGRGNEFRGSLNADSRFFRDTEGSAVAHVSIRPSEVLMGDTLWQFRASSIAYRRQHLHVDHFLLEHGRQHIGIDGTATRSADDSLVVSLRDVNVAYIMNLVNFHSVEFSGHASGTAVAKTLFATPEARASLSVSDFRFEDGRMGTLSVDAAWDNALGQINIAGRCDDPNVKDEDIKALRDESIAAAPFSPNSPRASVLAPTSKTLNGETLINGYVSIKRNYIDLDMQCRNTRLEFMQTFCDSFLDDVTAWASGRVRLWGDLSAINLTGEAVAQGSLLVTPLNTRYTLPGDTVRFVPDDILFSRCPVADASGNHGYLTGGLHHRHLARMTYDISVEAEHMLCFDFPTLDGSTFCGHVIGSGTCQITGRPGELTFDIEAYPEQGSSLTYNVASPDAIQNQEFITWRDATKDEEIKRLRNEGIANDDDDFLTNIRMNFLIHAQPTSTLRLIMDEQTGDYITLNGNGTLRATYYNKGAMQIFGNYHVTAGEYKMTIQKVITKSFQFQPGGMIAFGGDPFQASINLQAQYVVPSVPLSDLNIGNSFSNNTVRVNCLMNIGGTAEHPAVDFDLSIPQASADVQQMITSVMDSEQERSQQVLYLLSVGRFYVANNNMSDTRQSQTALAMQSLLSGTISQQINNLISDQVLKSRNWNFGANISPGDEGMMNAEYEGIVSGRMLNNRLLINGQFGYRDNANATTSFIGDFDIRYLLFPNGNLQVRFYNQTSDRYFTRSNLNTQGIGIIFKHDFTSPLPAFLRRRKPWQTNATSH